MALFVLTEEQVALLQIILDNHKGLYTNPISRPPTEHSWSEGEDHQAPETYVAKPQTSAGIPKLLSAGTGTDESGTVESGSDYDEPGKADCDIYRIHRNSDTGDPELHNVGVKQPVHNLSGVDLDQDWIPITRTKFGSWVSLFQNLTRLEWAVLDESLSEGGSVTASIYRGGPTVSDLVDSGEGVLVGAPPLFGVGTGTSDALTGWVLIGQMEDGYWWVIGAACE